MSCGPAAAVLAPVIVRIEPNPPIVGMPEIGKNAHVTPVGWPVQESEAEVLKPFSAVNVIGTVSELDCPGGGCGMVIAPVPSTSVKSLMLSVMGCAACDWPEFIPVTCTV